MVRGNRAQIIPIDKVLQRPRCLRSRPCVALTDICRSERSFLNTRNDQPVVDCAYGYQKENQEEADEVEENCG